MKSFLKYLLATIVGIIIVHVILFFVFIGLVGAIASFSSPTIEIKDNTILKLSLKTAIPDRASENPFQNFNLMTMSPEKQNMAYIVNLVYKCMDIIPVIQNFN